ncbi:MAG: hypothetical protein KAJ19_12475 [Gammaproteobacteria bacterium]|nr:hypothetical protein [Gammaproteobacteria bacterium]
MPEESLTPDEIEVINTGKCKVIARDDGSITIKCEVDEELEMGPQDINLVAGVSQLATDQKENSD